MKCYMGPWIDVLIFHWETYLGWASPGGFYHYQLYFVNYIATCLKCVDISQRGWSHVPVSITDPWISNPFTTCCLSEQENKRRTSIEEIGFRRQSSRVTSEETEIQLKNVGCHTDRGDCTFLSMIWGEALGDRTDVLPFWNKVTPVQVGSMANRVFVRQARQRPRNSI